MMPIYRIPIGCWFTQDGDDRLYQKLTDTSFLELRDGWYSITSMIGSSMGTIISQNEVVDWVERSE